jgi:phenylacetate-coenzyme A ligase PaaK-like adenylate-forming protein
VTFFAESNPGPWAGRRIADVEGRLDEVFTYPNGVAVHPHLIRSILTRASVVVEYQIRQTGFGIDALLRANGDIDCSALAAELTAGLRRVGLPDPRVEIAVVDRLERHAQSGKLKRFIPLMS